MRLNQEENNHDISISLFWRKKCNLELFLGVIEKHISQDFRVSNLEFFILKQDFLRRRWIYPEVGIKFKSILFTKGQQCLTF